MFQASNVPIKVPEPLQSAQTAPVESHQPAAAPGIAKPQPPASTAIDKPKQQEQATQPKKRHVWKTMIVI